MPRRKRARGCIRLAGGAVGFDVMPAAEAMEKSGAMTKALGIDDKLAEAHTSLAFVVFSYDLDLTTAEKEFQRAISLNPNYPTAHQWYSGAVG